MTVPSSSYARRRTTSFADRILRWFPVPKLLDLPTIGIDISRGTLRFVELVRDAGGIRLGEWGSHALSESAGVPDAKAERARLIDILRRVRSKIRTPYVYVSLPTERSYLFEAALPSQTVGYAALRRTIEFHLEENVPLAPRDAVFDAASEDRTAGERGTVAVAVVPAALVEEYLGLFTESGFQPLSFEVAAESVARAVVPRASREAALILRLGSDRTHLIFARGRSAVFATTVEFGGRSLTDSLVRGLGIGEDEAERLKREHGLAPSQEHRKAAALLRERLAALTTELARYIGYWNTHHAPASQNGHGPSALEPSGAPARGIARVLLCGGGANLRAFAPFLSAALDLPVSFGNVWTNCFSFDDYIPALPRDESFGYCAAVGLALRGVG